MSSTGAIGLYKEFLQLKFMAALIHNEVCRERNNFINNPTNEASNLLARGPIILKLFEAKKWYSTVGNKKLLELAKNRNTSIEVNLKELKRFEPDRIEKYKVIRDKLVAHYTDEKISDAIQELETVQLDDFYEDVEKMVNYGMKWLQALSSIGKLR